MNPPMPTDRVFQRAHLGLNLSKRDRVSDSEIKLMNRLLLPPFTRVAQNRQPKQSNTLLAMIEPPPPSSALPEPYDPPKIL